MNDTDRMLNELMDSERNWRRFVMLSAGLSQIWQRGGRVIGSYHALIEDDWSGSQAGLEQLRSSERMLQLIQECSTAFSTGFDHVISRELLGIAPVLEGVLGVLNRQYEHDFFLVQSVSALINGDAFYLQETLRDMMEEMLASGAAGNLNVNSCVLPVSQSDVAQLRAEIEPGNYVLLSFTSNVSDPMELLSYVSACDVERLQGTQVDRARYLGWLGCASLHDGECLIHKDGISSGMALLLPVEEQSGSSDVRAKYRNGRPETVLVVDDEDMIWDVVINMLGDLGYTVLLAANGQDAVDIYRANLHEIDLVLMDMLMPVMSGREAFHQLKASDPDVNVLLASGYVDEAEVQDVLRAGARGFMRKPYKLSDLAQKVRAILDAAGN